MWEIFTLAKDIPYEDMQDEELVVDATQKHPRTLLAKPTNCPAIMTLCICAGRSRLVIEPLLRLFITNYSISDINFYDTPSLQDMLYKFCFPPAL